MLRILGCALALSFLVAGCAADCESLCEAWAEENCCDKNDLEGAGCIDNPEDCGLMCHRVEALAERAECEDELDAWNECAAGLDDICDDTSSCSCAGDGPDCEFSCEDGGCDQETADYFQCTSDYCLEHPDEYVCS